MEMLDEYRICLRDVVCEQLRAERHADASHCGEIFDRHRNAVKPTKLFPVGDRACGIPGLFPCTFFQNGQLGVSRSFLCWA